MLVIEDTPAVRQLLALALRDEGYEVAIAEHGGHALQVLNTVAPCLILLDLRMPVMDGFAFAQAYRDRKDADAHIIVLTAEPWRDAMHAINAVHVEPKPFDLGRFLSTIEYWCLAHVPQSG